MLPRALDGLVLGVWFGVLANAQALPAAESAIGSVDFNRDIRPILSKNCLACHGQDAAHRATRLRLDQRESATKKQKSGATPIVAGAPKASELFRRISTTDEADHMPPKESGKHLTPAQIATLGHWIEQGAPYAEHWAFVKPKRYSLPPVKNQSWPRNGIDYFVLSRLEREGFKPAPEADRFTLLRRASLDLRGLPPTPQEIDLFTSDTSGDAYEKAVDRFLKDPAFGERWARMWLDLARYADSAGYGSDPLRTIWRYRDWVIDAYNRNLPYDKFTIDQIAGDLLPKPTLDERMATAFHRNTMTNTEGGTDREEFRVAAVKDRVDTTLQVWMGLTMGCAKCHNHKYEPITQAEYYRFYAFFNQTADADRPDEKPVLQAPTREIEEQIRHIDARIATLKTKLDSQTPELAAAERQWQAEFDQQPAWRTLDVVSARSEAGAHLVSLPDRSLRAEGINPPHDTYTISGRTDLHGLTALRLETIPDPTLPRGGAGRAADGNFVLSHLSITAGTPGEEAKPIAGRFVRIEIPGDGKILSLAEVEVFSKSVNIARAGKAEQSSTDYGGVAARAIDGNTNGEYFAALSTTHTRISTNPWWEVKLAAGQNIERILIWNRTDGGVGVRLANFRVQVLDDVHKVVWHREVAEAPSPKVELLPSTRLAWSVSQALADFSQNGFAVASVLNQKNLSQAGWAVAPQQSQPHAAVFLVSGPSGSTSPRLGERQAIISPLPRFGGEGLRVRGTNDPGPGPLTPDPSPRSTEGRGEQLLTIRLEQRFKDAGYNLGRFRLSVTNDPRILARQSLPAPVLAILATPAEKRGKEQREALSRYYRSIAPALQPVRAEIARLEKSRPALPTLPVMVELSAKQRRETHIMVKGNFLAPGDKVEPGIPAAFNPLPSGAPSDRLGVAKWLIGPENPLTARVAVNRYWSQLFGTGLVESEEDFGTQGDMPSHPELLDWLATEYVRLGWDSKALLREIVTSAAYRQSSKVTPEVLAKDPRNRLLTRGPRFRLEAEMVRDQALSLSGLLSRKMYGPSVFPPQPPGLWQAAFNGQRTWATSQGEDRYRRGIYTFWRRTVPYPSMATFDAPSRETCTVRRVRTNTPLQALVTLNDPVYVEISQALARRIVREGGSSAEERSRYGLRLCLARPAQPAQVEEVLALYKSEREHYRENPKAALELATDPLGPLPAGMTAEELAAWTVVANVLLNLDGVLVKG
ncbi:MAG TPA: DUF1553 domain-containing protein [Gemmataceae bacterium]|nr:DUF1553 domain-containing protein [Gemmataceae bacterium]